MLSDDEMIEIARICARQARLSTDHETAAELRRMALNYQSRVADLSRGNIPDVDQDENEIGNHSEQRCFRPDH